MTINLNLFTDELDWGPLGEEAMKSRPFNMFDEYWMYPAKKTRPVVLSTDHAMSSFGQPVLMDAETREIISDYCPTQLTNSALVGTPEVCELLKAAGTSWLQVTGG